MSRRQKGMPRESTLERQARQYLGQLYKEGKIFTFREKKRVQGQGRNERDHRAEAEGFEPIYHGSWLVGYAL